MSIKKMLFSLITIIMITNNAYASKGIVPPASETKRQLAVKMLQSLLHEGMFVEQYTDQALQPIRAFGNGQEISQSMIDELNENTTILARQQQLSRLIAFDLNLDTQITKEEVLAYQALQQNRNEQFDRNIDNILKMDTNQDGIVSYKEMGALDSSVRSNARSYLNNQYGMYLQLDPNADGIVTAKEIESITRKLFSEADKNKNEKIDRDEKPQINYSRSKVISSDCVIPNLKLPKDTIIYGAGAYSGRQTKFYIDSSREGASQIDITVTEQKRPIALILGAYNPTLWNIKRLPDTKIAAILLVGYQKQIIAGLPENTPTLISTYENKGVCGTYGFAQDKLNDLNLLADQVFNKPVSLFYPVGADGTLVIGSDKYDAKKVIGKDVTPEAYQPKPAPAHFDKTGPLDNSIESHEAYEKTFANKTNRKSGEFARFGAWDYGSCHGNDDWMCDETGANKTTGCERAFHACASGIAVAKKMYEGDGQCVIQWWEWVCK